VSDEELAKLAQARDPRAASEIWQRYSTMVRGMLRRTLGPSDVEDLVQDVFLRFFDKIGELRDPAAMRSFLIGITLRVAGTHLRRKRVRRWMMLTDTGAPPDEHATTDDPQAREAVRRLYSVLDKVDDEGRLAFVLRHFEGYELTEVATALGVSLATVKRRLASAQERVDAMVARDPLLKHYIDEGAQP
jgi:RNA polymerase sigma-70 factor (ECF subfamily)